MNDNDKYIVCILGLLLSPVLLGYVLPTVVMEIGYILFNGKSPMSLLVLVFGVLITAIILKLFFDSRDTTKSTKPKKDKTKKKRKSGKKRKLFTGKFVKSVVICNTLMEKFVLSVVICNTLMEKFVLSVAKN